MTAQLHPANDGQHCDVEREALVAEIVGLICRTDHVDVDAEVHLAGALLAGMEAPEDVDVFDVADRELRKIVAVAVACNECGVDAAPEIVGAVLQRIGPVHPGIVRRLQAMAEVCDGLIEPHLRRVQRAARLRRALAAARYAAALLAMHEPDEGRVLDALELAAGALLVEAP